MVRAKVEVLRNSKEYNLPVTVGAAMFPHGQNRATASAPRPTFPSALNQQHFMGFVVPLNFGARRFEPRR